MIAASFKCITTKDLTDVEFEMLGNLGSRAKFYCTVRSCDKVAGKFLNSIGPLPDQVDGNTKRIEDL